MKFTIPLPLQHEHDAWHERLRHATQAGGEAAKTLVRLMHPHFVKEEVMYPAAVLVGQMVRQRLGLRVPAAN